MIKYIILFLVLGQVSFAQLKTKIPLSKAERELKALYDDALMGEKNPATSFVCSLLLPGLGQFYNEETGLGFGIMGTEIVLGAGIILCNNQRDYKEVQMLLILLACVTELYAIIDAPIESASLNKQRRSAIFELKSRGLSPTSLNINPYVSPSNGIGLALVLNL